MGEITTRKAIGAPARVTPEMDRLISVMRNRLEAAGSTKNGTDLCSISVQSAPTRDERQALQRRSMHLADALAPKAGDRSEVADAILEMFYAWSDTRRMDAGKAAATASKYAATVSDLPLWAIVEACDKLTREDRDFPPSSGTLRAATVRACSTARDELTDLRKILTAEVYTPTKHGPEAVAKVNELAADLKAKMSFRPRVNESRQAADARDVGERDTPTKEFVPPSFDKPATASPALLDLLRR